MIVRKNPYYDTFRCLAGRCPDSCCKEWDVLVDPDSARRYRTLPGPLGDRLRQVLAEDADGDTVMTIENGRCPMWRQDSLCRIQAELGHDALCKTCREFPRLTHDYGSFVELGLELSCPEAARLLLTAPRLPVIEVSRPGGEDPEYDPEAMEVLLRTRETALSLLRDPGYSVPQALSLLLIWGCQAQEMLDGADCAPFDPSAALETARQIADTQPVSGEAVEAFFGFYSSLEILSPSWHARLTVPPSPGPWSEVLRRFAECAVERYWLQAVSDYDLICRVKMLLCGCILARLLGGDPVQTVQQYSKEIDNNADNLDTILDAMYSHPAFTDRQLLKFLLIFP